MDSHSNQKYDIKYLYRANIGIVWAAMKDIEKQQQMIRKDLNISFSKGSTSYFKNSIFDFKYRKDLYKVEVSDITELENTKVLSYRVTVSKFSFEVSITLIMSTTDFTTLVIIEFDNIKCMDKKLDSKNRNQLMEIKVDDLFSGNHLNVKDTQDDSKQDLEEVISSYRNYLKRVMKCLNEEIEKKVLTAYETILIEANMKLVWDIITDSGNWVYYLKDILQMNHITHANLKEIGAVFKLLWTTKNITLTYKILNSEYNKEAKTAYFECFTIKTEPEGTPKNTFYYKLREIDTELTLVEIIETFDDVIPYDFFTPVTQDLKRTLISLSEFVRKKKLNLM